MNYRLIRAISNKACPPHREPDGHGSKQNLPACNLPKGELMGIRSDLEKDLIKPFSMRLRDYWLGTHTEHGGIQAKSLQTRDSALVLKPLRL
eukprot:13134742-Alexandrium_andersonii.AAC.1